MSDNYQLPRYTLIENRINYISHGLGAFFSVIGTIYLIFVSIIRLDVLYFISSLVYGITLTAMYASSALYHSARKDKVRHICRILDHCAIFLLIAGTYTPFILIYIKSWSLFITIWAIAIGGVIFNIIDMKKYAKISVVFYLGMGWFAVVMAQSIISKISFSTIILLLVGGIVYTVGIIFFLLKKYRYMHCIWHFFVIVASIFHFFAIALYVIV